MIFSPTFLPIFPGRTETSDRVCFVFEYVSGGELFQHIVSHGRFKETEARRFFRQLVAGVEYCHYNLVIHRDLKPENILLDEKGNIKITDFGLSNILQPGKRFDTFCRSLHYVAPEILKGAAYLGPGVDIWALGIILYCLVVGGQPWDAEDPKNMMAKIQQGLTFPSHISEELKDLIRKMLTVDELQRISIAAIKEHPWVNEGYTTKPGLENIPAVKKIKSSVMKELEQIGFQDTAQARKEILENKKTQIVTMYQAFLHKHEEERNERKAKKQSQTTKRRSRRTSLPPPLAREAPVEVSKEKTKSESLPKPPNTTLRASRRSDEILWEEEPLPSPETTFTEQSIAVFGWNTTSTKAIPTIKKEIARVLAEDRVEIQLLNDRVFHCRVPEKSVLFEVEVANLPRFSNLRGIRLKKIQGNMWDYINYAKGFVSKLRL